MSDWRAERPVSLAQARAWIFAQHPELEGTLVEPYATGWDNVAYRVAGQWIFRFPQRAIGVEPMRSEIALLPELGPRLPMAVPLPRYIGQSPDAHGWPFAGYRELAGVPVPIAAPAAAIRARWAEPLGRFLRVLHDQDLARLRGLGLPEQSDIRRDWTARTARVRERLEHACGQGWIASVEPYQRFLRLPGERAIAVVHGDLHARHVLVRQDEISGVIDWGDVHAGDPAMDLAIAMMLPLPAHAAFRAAYGAIDEATWERARFEALYQSLALLAWATDIGDEDLFAEVQLELRSIA